MLGRGSSERDKRNIRCQIGKQHVETEQEDKNREELTERETDTETVAAKRQAERKRRCVNTCCLHLGSSQCSLAIQSVPRKR